MDAGRRYVKVRGALRDELLRLRAGLKRIEQDAYGIDPGLALKVYAQAMRLDPEQNAQLTALVEGADWANMGQRGASATDRTVDVAAKSAVL